MAFLHVKNYNNYSRHLIKRQRCKMLDKIEDVAGKDGFLQAHHDSINHPILVPRNITDAVSNKRIPSEKSEKASHKVTQRQQQPQPERPDWWHVVNRVDPLEECLGHRVSEIEITKELLPSLFKSESESEIMEECSQEAEKTIAIAGRGLM
jgi:hypothetical protein